MADSAEHIAREAKGLQQGLKESLKTHEPWDRDIQFQRINLRKRYLRLLLQHPYAKESKEAETHLWMQTSYAFISIYKQRVLALDRASQSASRQPSRQGVHGPVEYRKLLQRFRQFLAEEEKFWTQLVVRLKRDFALTEAQPALTALRIMSTADDVGGAQEQLEAQGQANAATNRSNAVFPPEDTLPPTPPATAEDRASRLAILTKALVCLGDIARYRELYNEAGGRPRAGHEDYVPVRRNMRNKRGEPIIQQTPRPRNYDKAFQCYEQARLLVPQEGNPSHQLAILASYQKDSFGSLYHYYRALCVRQPYDTAADNLGTVLTKALEQWKTRMKKEKDSGVGKDPSTSTLVPRLRVEALKESVVVLHALWRLRIDKMDSTAPNHAGRTIHQFSGLVSDRILPIDLITKVIVLSQGALWKHKMIADTSRKKPDSPPPSNSSSAMESRILAHVLGLHRSLLANGVVQLAESPPEDAAANDLAQRITATFRRTLPALRIASKWLRANFKYIKQSQAAKDAVDHSGRRATLSDEDASAFWVAYSQFFNTLSRLFPAEHLPSMNAPLEEDVEMRGFLPLRALMFGELKEPGGDGKLYDTRSLQGHGQVHPNEEQLMRIADLLNDAKALASEGAPLIPDTNSSSGITSKTSASKLPSGKAFDPDRNSQGTEDDALTEATSHDDPVGDAFRTALSGPNDDLEEEEQIVWSPGPPLSPLIHPLPKSFPSPPHHVTPMSPAQISLSPALTSTEATPTHGRRRPSLTPATTTTGTTAQDLLNTFMGPSAAINDINRGHHRQASSAPQPQLLFGSGPPNGPGHSIWSTSLDDSSLKFQGVGAVVNVQAYPSSSNHFPTTPPQDSSTSIWSSPPLPHAHRKSQNQPTGSPLAQHGNALHPIGHQRHASGQNTVLNPVSAQHRQSHDYQSAGHTSQHGASQDGFSQLYSDPAVLSVPTADTPYQSSFHPYHHDHRVPHSYVPPPLWGST